MDRLFRSFVFLLFFTQAMVPAGYMPAAISSGAPFQLCPEGIAPETMAILHEHVRSAAQQSSHTESHEHGDSHNAEWQAECEYASLGSLQGPVPILDVANFVVPTNARSYLPSTRHSPLKRVWRKNLSRAPPARKFV